LLNLTPRQRTLESDDAGAASAYYSGLWSWEIAPLRLKDLCFIDFVKRTRASGQDEHNVATLCGVEKYNTNFEIWQHETHTRRAGQKHLDNMHPGLGS
jgi:hypothetical protein